VLWLGRTDREHDNVRTALRWALDRGEADIGLRTAAPLWRFWQQRGHLREGREWLERLLSLPSAAERTAHRAKALGAAGSLAYWQNDYGATEDWYRESVDIYRDVGDKQGLADALYNMAFIPMIQGDTEAAQKLFDESFAAAKERGDRLLMAHAQSMSAYNDMVAGRFEGVVDRQREVVATIRELGRRFELADNLTALAEGCFVTGDVASAREALRESTELFREANNPTGLAMNLRAFASVESAEGRFERAARLFAAHEAAREETGGGAPPELINIFGDPQEASRDALGPERFEAATQEGRAMGLDKAVAYALEENASEGPG
jgi:tetratricopeptide (TPR) repeat protein